MKLFLLLFLLSASIEDTAGVDISERLSGGPASTGGVPQLMASVGHDGEPLGYLILFDDLAVMVSALEAGDLGGLGAEQILTTRINDPNFPDEPWECTTFRLDGESYAGFIKRHKETVDAVRTELGVI